MTNTLKTKTVQVRKQWVDNYAGALAQHYDVHLTLANTDPGVTYQAQKTIEQEGDASLTVTESNTVSFTVPQYLANGSPAHYMPIGTVLRRATKRRPTR